MLKNLQDVVVEKTVVRFAFLIFCFLPPAAGAAEEGEVAAAAHENTNDFDIALRLFQEGVDAFARKDYGAALLRFNASYDRYRRASTVFNIAMCHLALKEPVEAAVLLKQFLASDGNEADPALSAAAEQGLVMALSEVGRLMLTNIPENVHTYIDDALHDSIDDKNALLLASGNHRVTLEQEGRMPVDRDVFLPKGEQIVLDVANILDRASPSPPPAIVDRVPPSVEPLVTPKVDRVPPSVEPRVMPKVPEKPRSLFFLSGVAAAATGLAGVGLGVYFSVRYNQHVAEANVERNKFADTHQQIFAARHDRIVEADLPRDEIGAKVAYAVGGAALLTGASLIVLDLVRNKRTLRKETAISPTVNGIQVRF